MLAEAKSEFERVSNDENSLSQGPNNGYPDPVSSPQNDLHSDVKKLSVCLQQAKRMIDMPPAVRLLEPAQAVW